ncbi:MAG: translocation/assembly module TamB domain-containing protein [bacterium]
MKNLFKIAAFFVIAALCVVVFFPFEKARREIGRSISSEIRKSGINISYGDVDTDYFRMAALNEVKISVPLTTGERSFRFKKIILYFGPFFIFRKPPELKKVFLNGLNIRADKNELKEIAVFFAPGKKESPTGSPSVKFSNIFLQSVELNKTFEISGKLQAASVRANIASGGFRAGVTAANISGIWEFEAGLKNLDFFSVFFTTSLFTNENFTGRVSGSLKDGKVYNITAAGRLSADELFAASDSGALRLRDFKSRVNVSEKGVLFSKISSNLGSVLISGSCEIKPLSANPLIKGEFEVRGSYKSDSFTASGIAGNVSAAGFLGNPVVRFKGGAQEFVYGEFAFENCLAAVAYNEKNAEKISITDFSGDYSGFAVKGRGFIHGGEAVITGSAAKTVKIRTGEIKLFSTFESSGGIKLYPEIEVRSKDRSYSVKGKCGIKDGVISLDLREENKGLEISAEFSLRDDIFKISSFVISGSKKSFALSGGQFTAGEGRFNLNSDFFLDVSGYKDNGSCRIKLSEKIFSVVLNGKKTLFKYGQDFKREKFPFTAELTALPGKVNAKGKIEEYELKGEVKTSEIWKAGVFVSSFRAGPDGIFFEDFSLGSLFSGNVSVLPDISGEVKINKFPLHLLHSKFSGDIRGALSFSAGAFSADVFSGGDKFKIDGSFTSPAPSQIKVVFDSRGLFSGEVLGEFSGFSLRRILVPKGRVYFKSGFADIKDSEVKLDFRSARIGMDIRNIEMGGIKIFADCFFDIDFATQTEISGRLTTAFFNDLFFPLEFKATGKGETLVFEKVPGSTAGISGKLVAGAGDLDVFFADGGFGVRILPGGQYEISSEKIDLQKVLKLLKVDLQAFGDIKAAVSKSAEKTELNFLAEDIFVGSFINAQGRVKAEGGFIYPEIKLTAPSGFFRTQGFLASSVGQVNNFSMEMENLKLAKILLPDGEIRDFCGNCSVFAGGTFEMPNLKGSGDFSFEVAPRGYPERMKIKFRTVFNGRSVNISGQGQVKDKNFGISGKVSLADARISGYDILLDIPDAGVPVIVPGLLIQGRSVLKYIVGSKPSRGLVSGKVRAVFDGEKTNLEADLKIKNAKFSYTRGGLGLGADKNMNVKLNLKFDKNVRWMADNFKADIYGELKIEGPPFLVNGKLSTNQGSLYYLGKTLRVDFAEVEFVNNRCFLTLKADAPVRRKSSVPPFDEVEDTVMVDIKHSPLDSLDINLTSKEFSKEDSRAQDYRVLPGKGAGLSDIESMKNEIAKIIDSSFISPIFSEFFQEAGLADEVKVEVPAFEKITDAENKLSALDMADRMNLYMGKSFGKMHLGYNIEFMRNVSSLDLRHGIEVMYRIKGNNVLKAVYMPDEEGEGRKYLGIERHIRF